MFPDNYPYTNFHELNLGYFIIHFREIFSQWADLYDQMLNWKSDTDADLASWKSDTEEDLATWKAGVEADLDQRETTLRAELEAWKTQTGQDIAGWETATLAALTAWQTATQAVFEAIRVEAAGSATAAAASATNAATAKTAAETAQAAAEAAAASVTSSAAQIATNTADISDLKTQIDEIAGVMINPDKLVLGSINVSENGWEYLSRNYGVITEQGYTLPLKTGDKIYLTDYSEYKFNVSWKDDQDTYHWPLSWTTSGVLNIEADGDYVINVQLIDTTGTASVSDVFDILKVETDCELTDVKDRIVYLEDITEDIPDQKENTINLFNPYTITKGCYVGSDGAIGVNADYYLSDYIPVEPTKKYFVTVTMSTPAYAYLADKTPYGKLQAVSTIAGKGVIIQPNTSTHFIRVNGYTGGSTPSITVLPDDFMVIKGETAPTKYIPHRENGVIKANYTEEIYQDLIETVNLFDYDSATSEEYYEDGAAVSMSRYFHSAIIPVTAGKTYAVSTTLEKVGCFFNGDTFVSNIAKSDYTQSANAPFVRFTVPSGVDGVIVNGYLEEGPGNPSVTVRPEAYMMIEGQIVPSNYIPYTKHRKDFISDDYAKYDGNILRGKTLLTFGDSMTDARNHNEIENSGKGYMLNYAGYVADRNNMKYYNKGWSGGTIAYGSKPMLNSQGNIYINLNDVVYEPDYITLFYGFNDYNQGNEQLGTISDTDPATFYGAWNNAIEKLKAKYPKAKVGVMVVWGMAQEWHDAVIQVCQKYGVPYLDTCDGQFPLIRKNGTSLLDETWATARMAETTYDGTHPNDYGYYLMSTAYEEFLRRM